MVKNRKQKIFLILISFSLIFTILSSSFVVSAIEVSGNGSGGGSSSTTSGGSYNLPVLGDLTSNCAGYRFTVINAKGVRRSGTKTIDVYCSNSDFASHIKNNVQYYSSSKWYKTEISSGYIAGTGNNRTIGDTKSPAKDASMTWNSSIPQNAVQMTESATGGTPYFKTAAGVPIFNSFCQAMGLSDASALQNGNKVLIEPIFLLKIAGTEYLFTVSEIGLYGLTIFGNIVPASSGDTGAWANIAYYTNAYWPMSCKNSNDLKYSTSTIWYAAGNCDECSHEHDIHSIL